MFEQTLETFFVNWCNAFFFSKLNCKKHVRVLFGVCVYIYTDGESSVCISNTRTRESCALTKSRPTNEWLCYNLPRDGSYRNLLNYSDPCPGRRDPVVARVAVREDHFHPSIFDFDYTRPRESERERESTSSQHAARCGETRESASRH